MSELAFNMNGDPFEVPNRAVGWRVRRMKPKGAPEVVYGRNGLPLVLPIDAEVDDLRHEANSPGRYRLDPVGEDGKPIEEASAAYVFVHEERTQVVQERSTPVTSPMESALIEAMRVNAELARSVVDRFPVMMESAGLMLRAGGAIGLPRLLNSGIVNEDELGESDEGESAAAAPNGFDMSTLVAQVIPLVITALSNGNFKLPSVASLLDWRKAAPTHPNQAPISEAAARSSEPKSAQVPESTIPVMDPAMMAHFLTIQSALQPSEAAMARAVAADLQPVELRAWFDDLSKLSVPEAVSKIRAMIASGGAS